MLRRCLLSALVFFLFIISGCQALTLQGYANNQATKYTILPNSNVLDEAAIRSKIVGNTMVGISPKDDQEYVEYYLPDGTIKVFWKGVHYRAKWAISGYLWCPEYKGESRTCYMFSLDGDTVTWYGAKEGEAQEKATLLPGNARGL